MTNEELQAENKAFRDLLAAIADSKPPWPAIGAPESDWRTYSYALADRASAVTIAAGIASTCNGPAAVAAVAAAAAMVRDETARPLRYKPEGATVTALKAKPEPERVPWPTGFCGHPVDPADWADGHTTCRDCRDYQAPAIETAGSAA